MKFFKTLTLLPVLLLTSSLLQAHTQVLKAVPADGAVMHAAPGTIELNFSEDAQLLKFAVAQVGGKAVAVDFKPVADARKNFAVPLPALAPASYKVNWTVVGKDGHKVEGTLTFEVNPQATESAGKASTQDHHDHH